MVSRTNLKLTDEIREKLALIRRNAGNPSVATIAEAVGCSKSTINTAVSGYSIKWVNYKKMLEFLNCSDEDITVFRDCWIKSKTMIYPSTSGPIWAQELREKIDRMLEILERLDSK